MIRANKNENSYDLESLYWMTSVKGNKSDTRHHINTIHIDSGVGVKTNGSRLHIACLQGDYPDGDYEVVKRTKSEVIIALSSNEGAWPDWERIVLDCPVPGNGTEYKLELWFDNDHFPMALAIFYRDYYSEPGAKPIVQTTFIESAIEGFHKLLVWYEDNEKPLFFVDPDVNRVAALMPFRY